MFSSLRYFTVIVIALAFLIVCGLAFLQAVLRYQALPNCWRCGAKRVRHSACRSITDVTARILLLAPYRCRVCQQRFYAFRSHRPLPLPHS